MQSETKGTVIAVRKQWWLKVNTKPLRMGTFDGAVFPHILKVRYTVDGIEYIKRQWVGAGLMVPEIGSTLTVIYREDKPGKAKIHLKKQRG